MLKLELYHASSGGGRSVFVCAVAHAALLMGSHSSSLGSPSRTTTGVLNAWSPADDDAHCILE